jgi:hypothetical protein
MEDISEELKMFIIITVTCSSELHTPEISQEYNNCRLRIELLV